MTSGYQFKLNVKHSLYFHGDTSSLSCDTSHAVKMYMNVYFRKFFTKYKYTTSVYLIV